MPNIGVDFDILHKGKPLYQVLFKPVMSKEQLVATINQIKDLMDTTPAELIKAEVLKVPGVRDVVSVQ